MAAFDLGHGGSLIISRGYWQREKLLEGVRWAPAQRGGVGGTMAMRAATLPRLDVGPAMFMAVPTLFNEEARDLPTQGVNVGFDVLSRFELTVDYGHDALYVAPSAAQGSPLPRDRSGLRTEFAGDRLKVTYVAPDSPAAAAGINSGEEIVAIDGRAIGAGYYAGTLGNWETRPAGHIVHLRRADGREVSLKLANYF